MRSFVWMLVVVACLGRSAAAQQQADSSEGLIVFAAASLTDTLQKVSDAYTARGGARVKLSFAASSALARQIEAGARADVYFPADQEWMDYLETRRLIDASSRIDLLGNRLALIAPGEDPGAATLAQPRSILEALGAKGRLATGDPDSVPAGKYAKAALISLGLWKDVEARLARAENVRVALSYVARGEAPLGVVYSTDAAAEPRVQVIELFPESSHAPITYPIAAVARARPAARGYLAFLRGPEARKVFVDAGFRALAAAE
jgi:molybdate transport system substrate-binding protein